MFPLTDRLLPCSVIDSIRTSRMVFYERTFRVFNLSATGCTHWKIIFGH